MDILIASVFWTIMNNADVNTGIQYMFKSLLSIVLDMYPEIVILCIIFLSHLHTGFHCLHHFTRCVLL